MFCRGQVSPRNLKFVDVCALLCAQVIFVDADQIIRADMAELYDMDIDGKPLAYTPFCDNNKEMDGFRFWNQVINSMFCRNELQFVTPALVCQLARNVPEDIIHEL